MVTEVEAIINTRPSTYVYGDFMSGFTLTRAQFLTGNLDTVIPFGSDNCEDVKFWPKGIHCKIRQIIEGKVKNNLGSMEIKLFTRPERKVITFT